MGRLAYAVAYLEGGVLFDLPRHAGVVPTALSPAALAGKTTKRIADVIRANLAAVTDPKVAAWLSAAAGHLERAAELRNPVLHARPATVDGQQRLHRWMRSEVVTVDSARLTDGIAEIEQRCASLEPLRVW